MKDSLYICRMKIFIYKLIDPETEEVRYIGKTNNPRTRLNNHICHSKKNRGKRHVVNWICSLLNKGLKPKLQVIEECKINDWKERETFWISHFKQNSDITNHGKGGENSNGLHGESIASSKLILSQVVQIRNLLTKGYNTSYLANKYNVCKATITSIKLGRSWKELGDFKIKGKLNKITPEQANEVRLLLESKKSYRQIQSITGISRPTIKMIKDGKYK